MALTPGENSLLLPEEELNLIRQDWEQKDQDPNSIQAPSQSKYDDIRSMLKGLLNDTDGSYAKKILVDHPEEVSRFDEKSNSTSEKHNSLLLKKTKIFNKNNNKASHVLSEAGINFLGRLKTRISIFRRPD